MQVEPGLDRKTKKKITLPIAVASRTFSKHPILRAELLERFDKVKFNDQGLRLFGAELIDFLRGSQGAIVALEPVTDAELEMLPELRVLAKYGVGLDNLDQESMRKRGVQLAWQGGVNRRSVSELALGFMLTLLRKLDRHTNSVKSGEWVSLGGNTLSGRTVGILGAGFIGKDLAQILKAFGCRVLLHDVLDMQNYCVENGFVFKHSKDEVLAEADIVTLHVPLDATTRNFISHKEFSLMKSSAFLINTSRGGVVDEAALFTALSQQKIAGAAMDVFANEPATGSLLLTLENFVASPHIGGSSDEAILAMGRAAIENLYTTMMEL